MRARYERDIDAINPRRSASAPKVYYAAAPTRFGLLNNGPKQLIFRTGPLRSAMVEHQNSGPEAAVFAEYHALADRSLLGELSLEEAEEFLRLQAQVRQMGRPKLGAQTPAKRIRKDLNRLAKAIEGAVALLNAPRQD